jgi:hypothetical protein
MSADPLPWLLASPEPAARWVALTGLLDLPPDDVDVRRAHRDVVAAPSTASLVERLPDWTRDQRLSSHASPAFAPHLLGLLADMGVQAGDFARVDHLLDTMAAHQEPTGRFPSYGVAAPGEEPVWGALLCDSHDVLDALVRFGRDDDPRVRAGLDRMAADATQTTQGRAWPCLPHSVSGWRGPGRREDACPMVTLQALRAFSRLPAGRRPTDLTASARVLLRCWRERASQKPYQFGHGRQFKTVKWPPTWYGVYAVVDTIGRYPEAWSGPGTEADARAVAELTACLLAYNVSSDGTVTPRSTYRGFEDQSFGQKRHPSPFATALLHAAAHRVDGLAADIRTVDVRALTSSRGGTGTAVPPPDR